MVVNAVSSNCTAQHNISGTQLAYEVPKSVITLQEKKKNNNAKRTEITTKKIIIYFRIVLETDISGICFATHVV